MSVSRSTLHATARRDKIKWLVDLPPRAHFFAYLAWPWNAQMHRRLSSKQQMQQLATAAQKSAEEFSHKAASVIVSLTPFVLLLWMTDICVFFCNQQDAVGAGGAKQIQSSASRVAQSTRRAYYRHLKKVLYSACCLLLTQTHGVRSSLCLAVRVCHTHRLWRVQTLCWRCWMHVTRWYVQLALAAQGGLCADALSVVSHRVAEPRQWSRCCWHKTRPSASF